MHFAHGNGFPARCYSQLLNHLMPYYDVRFIDRIGHTNQFPVTENWHYLVEEIVFNIKQETQQPVIALGHSLGGVLSLMAAIEEPSLFKAVIMIDAPLLGRFKSSMVRLAKALGIIDRITPAARSKGRRTHWKSKEDVLRYLKSRDLFRTFTEQCLQDYIEYGLIKTSEGYRLRFDRHVEYLIYRTIPHSLKHYEGRLTVPTVLIYGDKSSVVDKLDISYMKNQYNISSYKMKGTHMLPMEYPDLLAKKIVKIVNAILNKPTI